MKPATSMMAKMDDFLDVDRSGNLSLPRRRPGGYRRRTVDDDSLMALLDEAAEAVARRVEPNSKTGRLAGTRAGQYRSDLAADAAALAVLDAGRPRRAVRGVRSAPP